MRFKERRKRSLPTLIALLIMVTLSLGVFAACGEDDDNDTADDNYYAQEEDVATDEEEETADIVYVDQSQWLSEWPLTGSWSQETTADGWIRVTNYGGVTLGFHPDSGVEILEVDGWAFKDMNGDGVLNIFEDWRIHPELRAADLAEQLTLEEIAGMMLHSGHQNAGMMVPELTELQRDFLDLGLRAVLNAGSGGSAETQIIWANAMQAYAERTSRLSIPVNISTDPRVMNVTRWPQNLALAALFDPDIAHQRAQVLSMEKRALGIFTYLGPQIDLGTEPRWYRGDGTVGGDPALARDIAMMTVDGYQSTFVNGVDMGWGVHSMNAMMKHWPGDGPSEGGRGSHQPWGEFNVFPGGGFETHLIPFVDGALSLPGLTERASAAMSFYSINFSETGAFGEPVGGAFSAFINGLLRDYGFEGPITTDWGVLNPPDWGATGFGGGRGFGLPVEYTRGQRAYVALMAGTDQFGGLNDVYVVLEAFDIMVQNHGEAFAVERFRESARRLTTNYFTVGMFDNPYVVLEESLAVIMTPENVAAGARAEQMSVVMLKNDGIIEPNWASNAFDGRPTVYIPLILAGAASPNEPMLPVPLADLNLHFEVITDTFGDPTGPENAQGYPTFRYSDIIRARAAEMAAADFAIVLATNPQNSSARNEMGWDVERQTFIPISLQFRPYRADSAYVRNPSLAGHTIITEEDGGYVAEIVETTENRSFAGEWSDVRNEWVLDMILDTSNNMPDDAPVILVMNTSGGLSGVIYAEFEEYVDAIFMGFSIQNAVFVEIALGLVEPNGLLPVEMPANMEAVERQLEDVPRNTDPFVDSMGNIYDFGFGLNWSGQISDWRTDRYVVPPLTTPQRQPVR